MGFLSSLQDVQTELFYISSLAKSNPTWLPIGCQDDQKAEGWRSLNILHRPQPVTQEQVSVSLAQESV